jgi:hypothetical protein
MSGGLWVVGCGRIFESIAVSQGVFAEDGMLHVLRLPSTDAIANAGLTELPAPSSDARVFVAVDQSALNYARFDLYGRLRMNGYKFTTMVHPAATVDPSAQLGENCWIGPGALIGPSVKIGHNTCVGAGALVDFGASLAANVWVGAAARVGADASVGTHSVIGADVRLGNAVSVGRHCSIETPGHYSQQLPDKTYIDPLFEGAVHIHGGGSQRGRARG